METCVPHVYIMLNITLFSALLPLFTCPTILDLLYLLCWPVVGPLTPFMHQFFLANFSSLFCNLLFVYVICLLMLIVMNCVNGTSYANSSGLTK